MKRTTALLLAAILCLCLAACSKAPESEEGSQLSQMETTNQQGSEQIQPESGKEDPEETMENPVQQDIELVGPWHLDNEKNDLAAFADSLDLFPGYGEWGASMEIRSDGQMSWYIGAEGWHGTYTMEDGAIHAQLVSDLEQSAQLWDFRITEEKGAAELEMDYQDMTIYWAYGDREDTPAMGVSSKVYVDRQGTDEIYSSLSLAQSDTGYMIEMEIYRLGYFRGTAVETGGILVYTDDTAAMKGTIAFDSEHAVFEVTESSSDLVEVGTTWVFPEMQEGFDEYED
ncbi:MAG: hypothetical protein ACI3W5_16670 [Faecousia sp.]